MGHGTDYVAGDRRGDPAGIIRPCEIAEDAKPLGDRECYRHSDGTLRWIDAETCPFALISEGFPLYPDGEEKARKHGLWSRWTDSETGEYLPDTEENWRRQGHWESCDPDAEGAVPDLNALLERDLLDYRFCCPASGHDCPAYYGLTGRE